jgi:hypothetical protein
VSRALNTNHSHNDSHLQGEGVGARSAKVRNLSTKTKYANETPPHAVFGRVSAGVSTYYRFENQKTRLASGS